MSSCSTVTVKLNNAATIYRRVENYEKKNYCIKYVLNTLIKKVKSSILKCTFLL